MNDGSPNKNMGTGFEATQAGKEACIDALPSDVRAGIDSDAAVFAIFMRAFPGSTIFSEGSGATQASGPEETSTDFPDSTFDRSEPS